MMVTVRINTGLKKGKDFIEGKANVEMMGHAGAIQCVQFLSPQYIIVTHIMSIGWLHRLLRIGVGSR
jgi:hypothetical protein